MADQSADDATLQMRFQAVVDAAGGKSRPDWLATALADSQVRQQLTALESTLIDHDGATTPTAAYQSQLTPAERATSGHFATDPAITTALCRWAIQPHPADRLPRVLDPATGSGVFLLTAVDRLAAIAPEKEPADRLGNIVGIDVDAVALAVTARQLLAAVESPPKSLPLYEADFFSVEPGPTRTVSVTDDVVTAGQFDAVVGNPPYVRQETVDIDDAREHLATFGPEGTTPYLDGQRALSRRSDAYVYFLTHATQFLRDGGRLAVVVPAKWLTTRYGEPFQQFLSDHYRLCSVVGFGTRAFDDAFVDTVLLLAERCTDAARRRETPVRFCRLDEQVSVTTLLSLVEAADVPGPERMAVRQTEQHRTVTIRQARLVAAEPEKLTPYLDAPAPFIRLLTDATLTPLGEFASVRRGIMTGANDFFFLDGDGPGESVANRFRRPAIKSIRDVDGYAVTTDRTDREILDVHEYVTTVQSETDGEDLETAVVDALKRDGYDGLATYVEWGECQGFHERSSCAGRDVWFDLGDCSAPALFVPKFFDERVPVIGNPDGLLASNAVDCVWTGDAVETRALLGVLNSTLTKAMLECWGRSEGGGALQVMTYELSTLPVPDPRAFPPATREAITETTTALLDGDEGATRRLDELVLDAIDADLSVEECRRLRERMVDRRVRTGERAASPLVEE